MGKDFKPAFYAIIPADVRYDTGIKPNAKLLYGEITALCNEKGYCWAENEYFAKLYGVNLKTISVWISQLVEKNYLERQMVYKPGTKEIDSRILRLPMPYHLSMKNGIPLSIEKRIPSPENNGEGKTTQNTDVTNEKGNQTLSMKKGIPLHEKMEDNNTYEYIHEVFNNNEVLKKNQNFIPLVVKWVTYKKQEKNQRYKTVDSLTSWIKKLIKFSAGDLKIAEDIVETSMANLWEGIFKPNDQKKYNNTPKTLNFAPQDAKESKYGGF